MTILRSHFKSLALVSFLLILAEANAQTTANNLRLLQEIFRKCAAQAVAALHAETDSVAIVAHSSAGENSPERLLHHAVVDVLQSKKGLSVFEETNVLKGVAVRYKLLHCDLTYSKLPGGLLGGLKRARAERAVSVSVDFDIHQQESGKIYWQGIVAESRKDTIYVNEIASLENSAMPFTTGRWLQRDDARRRWVEPFILAATTGAAIYTFYTLRSQ